MAKKAVKKNAEVKPAAEPKAEPKAKQEAKVTKKTEGKPDRKLATLKGDVISVRKDEQVVTVVAKVGLNSTETRYRIDDPKAQELVVDIHDVTEMA